MRSREIAPLNFTTQIEEFSRNLIPENVIGARIAHTIFATAGKDAAHQVHSIQNALDIDFIDAISKSDHGSKGAMFSHSDEMIVTMDRNAL